ncbi:DUF4064 domain-containing protein [Clostridium perfringens]|nr:DUF4064 domain-containing protein [Clostridium perfringens]
MKRTAEFVLGLIGGILGLLISFPTFIIMGFMPVTDSLSSIAWVTNALATVLAIVAIVFACLVNKKTKLSGIIMIITGVGLFLCNFLNIIPAILLLVAGIMSLARKIEKDTLQA